MIRDPFTNKDILLKSEQGTQILKKYVTNFLKYNYVIGSGKKKKYKK